MSIRLWEKSVPNVGLKFTTPEHQTLALLTDLAVHMVMSLRTTNKPWFLRVCSTNLLKTLCQKKKLLVRAISSFPTVFSTHLDGLSAIFVKFEIVVCLLFRFRSLKFVVWERVNVSHCSSAKQFVTLSVIISPFSILLDTL